MSDTVILDGELSLTNMLDGVAGTVIEVGHGTGIDTIVFNADYTLTFNMTNGETFTTGSIRGEQGEQGDDYVLTQADKAEIAGLVDTPVDDVQINGTSILSDGVANVPVGSASNFGVFKISPSYGTQTDASGIIKIEMASLAEIKDGNVIFKPISPIYQHASTFYGLAKAAGDTTQSASSNSVGTYTEEAKTAIRTMLGLEDVYQDYSSALTALGVI